ncbi:DUF302 domain-containing protein [Aquimarina sp. AU474]|uniref:DUF302 domain-containing protein n=1 Tax=Aquimarina sp. AU474 TaxID=2108529 RepID=UPI000D68DD53|nr:DUF302 domain-containing protein [Aquimarina sp. AU474]
MSFYKVYGLILMFIFVSCNQTSNDTSNTSQTESKEDMEITAQQGVITKKSTQNFEDTYASLVEIIQNNPNLKIVAQLDHQANAASVDLDLKPTKIIMFGNPKLGTPLMQSSQTAGLDLPQKMLVWENDEGVVYISYNDPIYLQNRHNIEKSEVLEKMKGALDKISNTAAEL